MNGDSVLDMLILPLLEMSGVVQCTETLVSVSTDGESVAVQVRVKGVPSYSGPVETLTDTTGVGTAGMECMWISCYNEKVLLTSDSDTYGR